MFDQSTLPNLNSALKLHAVEINYTPMNDEVPIDRVPLNRENITTSISIPTNKEADPLGWAMKCRETVAKNQAHILIPGTEFDMFGTRHGRGLGWYDRFLSQIPEDWLRIGVVPLKAFSHKKLIRKSWDEPIDWVLVEKQNGWCIYETHARTQS